VSIYKSKPSQVSWQSAKPFSVDLYNNRYPMCGSHMVWAVVGYKWVRIRKAHGQVIPFKVRRTEWDQIAKRAL
jgi:hypothetical protein